MGTGCLYQSTSRCESGCIRGHHANAFPKKGNWFAMQMTGSCRRFKKQSFVQARRRRGPSARPFILGFRFVRIWKKVRGPVPASPSIRSKTISGCFDLKTHPKFGGSSPNCGFRYRPRKTCWLRPVRVGTRPPEILTEPDEHQSPGHSPYISVIGLRNGAGLCHPGD